MHIRLATPADLDAIQTIIQTEIYLDKPGFYWHLPQAIDRAITEGAYFVGTVDSVIIGVISVLPDGEALWIDTIAIRADQQRKGRGRQLMQFVRELAIHRGLSRLRLSTYHEYGVRSVYEAMGFVVEQELSDSTVLVMRLPSPRTETSSPPRSASPHPPDPERP